MAEEYYNIGPELRNMDFYLGGVNAQAVLSFSLDSSVTATKIVYAQSSINIDSDCSVSSNKTAFASSVISIDVTKTATPLELLHILVDVDINLTTTTSAMKIAYASSSIGINSTLNTVLFKTTSTSAHIHNSADITILGTRIALANSSQSIDVNMSIIPKEILYASASFSILQTVLVNPPVKFSPNFIDTQSIRTLMIIDDKPITNHNRTLETSFSQVFVENKNWNNRNSRYYKRSAGSSKKTFNLSWKFLPNYRNKTVDNRMARDYLVSLAEDNDVHVLKIINQDANSVTPYTETSHNVFVRSYSETLVRRDLSDNVYYFDCNLTLEEA